ncbi:hypothetical protein KUTeg_023265 [Tegillarca granosa]|uniref:Uncharacterized protein n=1 Tax=Tegillarca granosa TaxID=220873 RepID=A0ABQ9E6R5_TEGGR|nr:hypothetical protein KUTeg_023265 [Tegillarca granosa]
MLFKMSAPRTNCLFVLSSAAEGVSAQSFFQAYTLASSNFTIQLASPGPSVYELARNPDFGSLPIIPEDFIKDHGGMYNSVYAFLKKIPHHGSCTVKFIVQDEYAHGLSLVGVKLAMVAV